MVTLVSACVALGLGVIASRLANMQVPLGGFGIFIVILDAFVDKTPGNAEKAVIGVILVILIVLFGGSVVIQTMACNAIKKAKMEAMDKNEYPVFDLGIDSDELLADSFAYAIVIIASTVVMIQAGIPWLAAVVLFLMGCSAAGWYYLHRRRLINKARSAAPQTTP